jgi:hypothetical protein
MSSIDVLTKTKSYTIASFALLFIGIITTWIITFLGKDGQGTRLPLRSRIVSMHEMSDNDSIPWQVTKLMNAYPDFVIGYRNGSVLFTDSSELQFNDHLMKSTQELLDNADLEDMFSEKYMADSIIKTPNNDAGRIRHDAFFMKIYGHTKEEVRSNLTEIVWCPALVNQRILVNKKNGVSKQFMALSKELDQHPEFKKYLSNIGGTFNFRKINGTNRLSMHSFGITIDINVSESNYWQWDCGCTNENGVRGFKNRIPIALVLIFEKHGFIWGGRWKHYDTMHFEYRPELLP